MNNYTGSGGAVLCSPPVNEYCEDPSPVTNKHKEHMRLETGVDKAVEKVSISQYTDIGDGVYGICGATKPKLTAGIYSPIMTQQGLFFQKREHRSDDWLKFNDAVIQKILAEIELFWNKKDIFKKYGILHRRGYLFYGPQGTGKTILVKQIITKLVADDGIIFVCDSPSVLTQAVSIFRKIEPTRKIAVVFEDIDALCMMHGESSLLSYLDGEDSNEYIINIATTNYPEKLDKRIIQRPRRFDQIIKIGYPNKDVRSYYFKNKLQIDSDDELSIWVDATENFTFAAMTELVISVKCLEIPLDVAKDRILGQLSEIPDSKNFDALTKKRSVGFN